MNDSQISLSDVQSTSCIMRKQGLQGVRQTKSDTNLLVQSEKKARSLLTLDLSSNYCTICLMKTKVLIRTDDLRLCV